MRIFSLDDNAGIGFVRQEEAADLRYELVHAMNYEEGLKLLEGKFDLYVLDGRFPREPGSPADFLGLEFAEEIRRSYPDANIVICSSLDENDPDIRKGVELSLKFLPKLGSTLEKLLSQ